MQYDIRINEVIYEVPNSPTSFIRFLNPFRLQSNMIMAKMKRSSNASSLHKSAAAEKKAERMRKRVQLDLMYLIKKRILVQQKKRYELSLVAWQEYCTKKGCVAARRPIKIAIMFDSVISFDIFIRMINVHNPNKTLTTVPPEIVSHLKQSAGIFRKNNPSGGSSPP